jgi:hypothetical protein
MNFFLQIINKVFNLNLSKQQLFLRAENFFSQNQFKILLVFTFLCFVFLYCTFKPLAITVAAFCYGFLYIAVYTLTLLKIPVLLFTFIAALAIYFCNIKQFISLVLLVFILFYFFRYFFKKTFFVLKLNSYLREVFFEYVKKEKTKFLCFEVSLTVNSFMGAVHFLSFTTYSAEFGSLYGSLSSEYAALLLPVFLSFGFFQAVLLFLSCLILLIFESSHYIKDLYSPSLLFMQILSVFCATFFLLFLLFMILSLE